MAFPASEHIVTHLQSSAVLESELFLDNMEKEENFVNNIIPDLTKIINKKNQSRTKNFQIELLKHLSESLT